MEHNTVFILYKLDNYLIYLIKPAANELICWFSGSPILIHVPSAQRNPIKYKTVPKLSKNYVR